MASTDIGARTAQDIVALREVWHTKDHPFFVEFSQGKFGLEPLGRLMAQHYQHVIRALPSFGHIYAKAPPEGRRFILENLAEEEGLIAGPGEDRAGEIRRGPAAAAGHGATVVRTTRENERGSFRGLQRALPIAGSVPVPPYGRPGPRRRLCTGGVRASH